MDPIRSTYEGDPDMLELVQEFAGELPARAKRLEELLEQAAWSELQTLAHQLKGAGGGYGFQPITDVAAALERGLREGVDTTELKQRTTALCETLRAVVAPEGT